ncbi:hypothetical protein NN561_012005 [Cricetulus griseus]
MLPLVIPGGTDTSTHFHQTFMNAMYVDDFYHETNSALVGGITVITSHVLPEKETSLVEAYENYGNLADPQVCCDYVLHVGSTLWAPMVKAEMETLARETFLPDVQHFPDVHDLQRLAHALKLQATKYFMPAGTLRCSPDSLLKMGSLWMRVLRRL